MLPNFQFINQKDPTVIFLSEWALQLEWEKKNTSDIYNTVFVNKNIHGKKIHNFMISS